MLCLQASELEKSMLRESLNNTSAKLSEAKIELNNWQHGHTTVQSDIQLEQTRTIESLELEIEYLKKCISQKDAKISNLMDKIKCSENYISNTEAEFKATIDKKNLYVTELRHQLQEQENEKEKLQKLLLKYHDKDEINMTDVFEMLLKERDEEIKHLEQKVSSLQSVMEEFNKVNSTDNDSKHRNFSNLESSTDSDVSRHAAMTEISAVPHYISIVSSTHVVSILFAYK